MGDYFAFGGCLRSELEFPDLSPSPLSGPPDWEFRLSHHESTEQGEPEGERAVSPPAWVLRLYRLRQGWRLEYGATGSYTVLEGGRRLLWHPGTDRREEVVRAVVLGPLMALALHESGILCLHGSAVAVGNHGIGFLAHKGYGKSTLAVALTAAGGRLMSDDLLAVTIVGTPEVLPGVHSVRVHSDVTELMADKFPGALLRDGWKNTLTNLSRDQLGWNRTPMDALYLLSPSFELEGDEVARRTRMEPMEATLSLAIHAKITDLLGHAEAGKMLGWIAALVSRIPIYRLQVTRDLHRLPTVATQILAWHGLDAAGDGES